jgi:hypothetical protein
VAIGEAEGELVAVGVSGGNRRNRLTRFLNGD